MESIVAFHIYNFYHHEYVLIVDSRNYIGFVIIIKVPNIVIVDEIDNNCVLLYLLGFLNWSKTVNSLKIALSNNKIQKKKLQKLV